MILDDEFSIAKKISEKQTYNMNAFFADMILLARYYFQIGKNEKAIHDVLKLKFSNFYSMLNNDAIEDKVSTVIQIAKYKGDLNSAEVIFYEEELNYIHSLNDIEKEGILFTLFMASKLSKYDRFSMSLVSLRKYSKSKLKQSDIISILGYFERNKIIKINAYKSNIEYRLCYNNDNNKNVAFSIKNKVNFVYYYYNWVNPSDYIFCEKCGNIEEKRINNQIYCNECKPHKYLDITIKKCEICGCDYEYNPKTQRDICDDCYVEYRRKYNLEIIKKTTDTTYESAGKPRSIDREYVISLKNEGKTQKEISEIVGCSRMQIYRILNNVT